jgi:hypothetical protein
MSGKAIRETLGFLAVVTSLVFVGMEIRQNTAVARGQARRNLRPSIKNGWCSWAKTRVGTICGDGDGRTAKNSRL